MVLGLSVGVLLGVIIGGGIGSEEIITVGLALGRAHVDSMGNYNDVIGRVGIY